MTIRFNVPGKERKRLALAAAEWLGGQAAYNGAPTFSYTIGERVTIDRNGVLTGLDIAPEAQERFLEYLYDAGFEYEYENEPETGVLSIQIPAQELEEYQMNNLHAILDAKGALIKKALGIDSLPVNRLEDRIEFPWFSSGSTPEEIRAYSNFITALTAMARNQKRITAKEKEVDNEKYAFRCFLLRLGFIGDEFKYDRKILLRNLNGSSAFRSPKEKEADGVCSE